jgi:uncharacterized protein YbbC (DUF1343 family)
METGLDRLARSPALASRLRDQKVGVLAHPASVTRDLVHIGVVLEALGIRPTVYFGPEHGFGGEAQDMVGVAHSRDRRGIPVRSLYGENEGDLVPKPRDLDDLDVLLIDLQDVGARYYTFVWTAVLAMRAAISAGKRVLVLDRPNPLGGDMTSLEGRSQLAAFRSFVGLESICVRHGLTLGEIVAHDAAGHDVPHDQVEIVGVKDLAREAHAIEWDRPFVPPSPNMPTYDTALVYPGGCLLEGTNLSEARGTTRPFETFGAPFVDGERLASDFHELALPGVRVRAISFRPTFHKYAGEVCGGVHVHPIDRKRFLPVATYVALIALVHEQAPARFAFRTERYEFVENIPAFDLLTGDGQARAMILEGARALDVANTIARLRPGDVELVRAAREALRPYEWVD